MLVSIIEDYGLFPKNWITAEEQIRAFLDVKSLKGVQSYVELEDDVFALIFDVPGDRDSKEFSDYIKGIFRASNDLRIRHQGGTIVCDCAQRGLKPCRVNPNFEKCFEEEGRHIDWRDPIGEIEISRRWEFVGRGIFHRMVLDEAQKAEAVRSLITKLILSL